MEIVEQVDSELVHNSADSLELQRKYLMDQSSTSSNLMHAKKPNLFILQHPQSETDLPTHTPQLAAAADGAVLIDEASEELQSPPNDKPVVIMNIQEQ